MLYNDGSLSIFLGHYTFIISCVIINIVFGYNNRTDIINSKCVYSHRFIDQIYTLIFLTLYSTAVVIIQLDITISLCELYFANAPVETKNKWTSFLCCLSAAFSIINFRIISELINKKGRLIAYRFLRMKLGIDTKNIDNNKK